MPPRRIIKFSCRVLPSPFQRLGVANLIAWFTFIFRVTGLRAVGVFVGSVLPLSRGRFTASPRPLCFYCSTLLATCQALFLFFLRVEVRYPIMHACTLLRQPQKVWGASLFVSLSISPESCSYFVNAESVLQRIFAAYNLAGVVSQSAGLGLSFP